MVHEQMDILGEEDARPEDTQTVNSSGIIARRVALVEEIAENGEAIVVTEDGRTLEFHGDDSHFYPREGVLFTEAETPDGDDAETWVFAEDIVSVQRH